LQHRPEIMAEPTRFSGSVATHGVNENSPVVDTAGNGMKNKLNPGGEKP